VLQNPPVPLPPLTLQQHTSNPSLSPSQLSNPLPGSIPVSHLPGTDEEEEEEEESRMHDRCSGGKKIQMPNPSSLSITSRKQNTKRKAMLPINLAHSLATFEKKKKKNPSSRVLCRFIIKVVLRPS
jgi:hypothetical protein